MAKFEKNLMVIISLLEHTVVRNFPPPRNSHLKCLVQFMFVTLSKLIDPLLLTLCYVASDGLLCIFYLSTCCIVSWLFLLFSNYFKLIKSKCKTYHDEMKYDYKMFSLMVTFCNTSNKMISILFFFFLKILLEIPAAKFNLVLCTIV